MKNFFIVIMVVILVCISCSASLAQETLTIKIDELKSQAESGNSKAQLALGNLYMEGQIEGKINIEKANEWWLKAAENGEVEAQIYISISYGNGVGINKNTEKSIYWANEAVKQGNPVGMILLGNYYLTGIGIEKNEGKAFELYSKSAEAGFYEGMLKLGMCYENGYGTTKDSARALQWYEKAAGKNSSKGYRELIRIYSDNKSIVFNPQKAIYWVTISVSQTGDPEMIELLGHAYISGFGVEKNEKTGVAILNTLVEKGRPEVAAFLGDYFAEKNNFSAAVKYFEIAAAKGNVAAIGNVAVIYYKGLAGDTKDAERWIELGVSKNDPTSIGLRGMVLYKEGKIEEGIIFLKKAAELGDESSKKFLQENKL